MVSEILGNGAVCATEPEVAVMVMEYVPAAVPGLPLPPPPPLPCRPPPQETKRNVKAGIRKR